MTYHILERVGIKYYPTQFRGTANKPEQLLLVLQQAVIRDNRISEHSWVIVSFPENRPLEGEVQTECKYEVRYTDGVFTLGSKSRNATINLRAVPVEDVDRF